MSACIVTGEIGSGKTTLLRQLYEAGGGDGILLPRLYCGGDWAGQRIERLGQGEGGTFWDGGKGIGTGIAASLWRASPTWSGR